MFNFNEINNKNPKKWNVKENQLPVNTLISDLKNPASLISVTKADISTALKENIKIIDTKKVEELKQASLVITGDNLNYNSEKMEYELDLEVIKNQGESKRYIWLKNPLLPVGKFFSNAEVKGIMALGKTVILDGCDKIQVDFEDEITEKVIRLEKVGQVYITLDVGDVFENEEAAAKIFENEILFQKKLAQYVADNREFVRRYLDHNVPDLRPLPTKNTIIMWVDISTLGISGTEFKDFAMKETGVIVGAGDEYLENADNFILLNLATSVDNIEEMLKRLQRAVVAYKKNDDLMKILGL